jgi:hypothetical protein
MKFQKDGEQAEEKEILHELINFKNKLFAVILSLNISTEELDILKVLSVF